LVGGPRPITPLAAALPGLALVWAAMLWFGGEAADRTILAAFYAGGDPLRAAAARWLTELGAYYTVATLSLAGIVLLCRRGLRRQAVLLFALVTTGPLFVELQKGWIGRLRPHDEFHLTAIQSYAFPSGHTANATMVWLGLALLLFPRAGGPRNAAVAVAILVAVTVGCTRLTLGVHWPSDVAGGWALGLFWLLLLARLTGVPLRSS